MIRSGQLLFVLLTLFIILFVYILYSKTKDITK